VTRHPADPDIDVQSVIGAKHPVDWAKLTRYLESCLVQIPEVAEGESMSPATLVSLLTRVQSARQRLDVLALRVTQLYAEAKRRADYLSEHYRQTLTVISQEPDIRRAKPADRKALIEAYTAREAASLVAAKARVSELQQVKDAVERALKTSDRAKETLNAIRALIVTEAGSASSGFQTLKAGPYIRMSSTHHKR
jgi:cell division protein FtsB